MAGDLGALLWAPFLLCRVLTGLVEERGIDFLAL
jgi:hypothetical protein